MAGVLIALGPYRFMTTGLNYQELERSFEYRWRAQNVVGGRPAQQFMGPGEETISLKGVMYPTHPWFSGALSKLEGMRAEGQLGVPRPMGSGLGRFFGTWCIRSISDTQTFFAPKSGAPRKVEFNIELVHFGGVGVGGLSISLF